MSKNKIVLGIGLLIIFLFLELFFYLKKENEDYKNEKKASLGECAINLEIVSEDEKRKRGLSNRDSLCDNCGMLFLFDKEGDYFFWMKDMRFPIDIIWLRDNEVVYIAQNVSHQSKSVYSSREKADKVLELNANDASRCNIKIGDKLTKKQ
ncbi:MAG: hypothetical protein UR60_C0015G0006 [Candidatus Moranbacteria bacterium GW2011_GWF2_34_56]|nr:MAG: hypothetical protein UR51_C0003G0023 [Candidatus Moranbacteria bacterium GW2011_GWF1_34_10]KKP64781.1 MAG: hypothetical protein UR60_C0015G0006 [Candidatus Moranbacteria bacterium GW2011_GWF2_34_56]HBI16848.1 hypothetical protein [Candidatus Moranbacteria bacterium]